MSYSSPLEARLAKKATKAITDFGLLEDGDRVMVGLSGGKDSWALLQILDVLRHARAHPVHSGRRQRRLRLQGLQARSHHEHMRRSRLGVSDRAHEHRRGDGRSARRCATPCSLCARLRRGVLYRLAREVGATKIALGHHLDDFIETLLLNLFFAGSLEGDARAPCVGYRQQIVIRPLVYVGEDEARAYTKEVQAPDHRLLLSGVRRPGLQRQRIKRLLIDLEREHPGVKQSMLKALGNVVPSHLLDTRLNPVDSYRVPVAPRAAGRPFHSVAFIRVAVVRAAL